MLTIYGIRNCDTCRKTAKWLDANSIDYIFHDLRADGLDKKTLQRWARSAGWQKLLNRRSSTWRRIPDSDKNDLGEDRALALMLEHPTLVKRPVAEMSGVVEVGFSADRYNEWLS